MSEHASIRIETYTAGPYLTNCYLVRGPAGSGSFVVDCGFDTEPLIAAADDAAAIVLTHAHVDHIAGLHAARRARPALAVWIHEAEEGWLLDAELNLSAFGGFPTTAPPADRVLADGQVLRLAGTAWEVRHVPGHSPGSVALYSAEASVVICGDALFAGSIGRTDFPGCDAPTLERSIRARLYTLPDDTVVYPGHGPTTTIGRERRTNPYVRG